MSSSFSVPWQLKYMIQDCSNIRLCIFFQLFVFLINSITMTLKRKSSQVEVKNSRLIASLRLGLDLGLQQRRSLMTRQVTEVSMIYPISILDLLSIHSTKSVRAFVWWKRLCQHNQHKHHIQQWQYKVGILVCRSRPNLKNCVWPRSRPRVLSDTSLFLVISFEIDQTNF